MQIIKPGNAFSFNYTAFDQSDDLFVQANVYDISDGDATLEDQIVMTLLTNGFYSGDFVAEDGKTYLCIAVCYEDDTYDTVDASRAPSADIFKCTNAPISFAAFNYATFDQNDALFMSALVYDVTTTPDFVQKINMEKVFSGVYFASFMGTEGHAYQCVELVYTTIDRDVVDTSRAPASSSFTLFKVPADIFNVYQQAKLVGPPVALDPDSPRLTLEITQGDTPLLDLEAQNGKNEPVDLTGATLTTYFRLLQGNTIAIPNSQHTINPDQVLNKGQFTLALTAPNTTAITEGEHKEIITKVVQGGSTLYFHGPGLITVLSPIPVT